LLSVWDACVREKLMQDAKNDQWELARPDDDALQKLREGKAKQTLVWMVLKVDL
jgi:hypothetical protein